MDLLLPDLFHSIEEQGGTCFYTGPAVRDSFLNVVNPERDILFYGITEDVIKTIAVSLKLAFSNNPLKIHTDACLFTFKQISGIHDIVDLHDIDVNSIYINCSTGVIYDPHYGVSAIRSKLLSIPKDVVLSSPEKIFEICRLTYQLGDFELSLNTWFLIYDNARVVRHMRPDLFKKELELLLGLDKPGKVLRLLQELRIMEFCIPELSACANVIQNKRSGVKNVFDHVMYALDACENNIVLRLTILFHDIGKPQTLEIGDDSKIHFFKHEIVGRDIAKQYLKYWGYDKDTINKVCLLVLHHMFDADPRLTDKSVRRLIKKVGKDHIYDLLKVREADRLGTPDRISMKKIKILKKKIDKELPNV